jgi:hypothetical protein
MSIYSVIVTSTNLSAMIAAMTAQDEAMRSLERGSTAPGVLVTGLLYNKTDYAWAGGSDDAIMRYDGAAFTLLMDPRSAQICAGGTVAMAADLPMGGFKITGMDDGVASTDGATVGQMQAIAAGAWIADHDAGGYLLKNLGSPFSQTSDAVAARYDDTWQTTHGLHRYIDAPAFDTVYGSGVTTGNGVVGGKRTDPTTAVNFCPRHLHLMLSGAVTPIGGGASITTLAETHVDVYRHSGNAAAWVSAGSFVVSTITYAIEVYLQTSGTLGFAVRVRRTTDNALFQAAVKHAWAFSGVGMA